MGRDAEIRADLDLQWVEDQLGEQLRWKQISPHDYGGPATYDDVDYRLLLHCSDNVWYGYILTLSSQTPDWDPQSCRMTPELLVSHFRRFAENELPSAAAALAKLFSQLVTKAFI